jgi:hypothetical protein
MGGKHRRNKKTTAVLEWPSAQVKKDFPNTWSEGLQAKTEIFILRRTQPYLTEARGNQGQWIAGDGSVDAQDRFQILMRNQLPKAICLTNSEGTPEIMKLAMKVHYLDFLGVSLTSLASGVAVITRKKNTKITNMHVSPSRQ